MTDATQTAAAAPRKPSAVVLVSLAALAALLGWTALRDRPARSLATGMPQPPPILAARKPCPDAGARALARAQEAEQAALAKAERYNFDPDDGVDAAVLYALALDCYEQAGDAESAARARSRTEHWEAALEARYQAHRLRLRLALDRGQHDGAAREARALQRLLGEQRGAYVEWLTALARKLDDPGR